MGVCIDIPPVCIMANIDAPFIALTRTQFKVRLGTVNLDVFAMVINVDVHFTTGNSYMVTGASSISYDGTALMTIRQSVDYRFSPIPATAGYQAFVLTTDGNPTTIYYQRPSDNTLELVPGGSSSSNNLYTVWAAPVFLRDLDGNYMLDNGMILHTYRDDPGTGETAEQIFDFYVSECSSLSFGSCKFSYTPRAYYIAYNASNSEKWKTSLTDYVPPEEDTDPYANGGGASGRGGGTGTFSRTGDLIGIPNLPTLSAVDAGFITIFNPSIAELRALASYMWSDAFSIETFKKIFADPMDCILGMSIVPVNVPNGSSKEVKVGNVGTGVSMTTAASQYVSVDCGTLNVEEYWGAYLDYDPYTKAEIYLPYIGTHPVAIDDVMGKSVHVVYHIDILSGACIAFIQCGGTVIYSFEGQCASSIPITGNDWTNVINGVLQIAGSIGTMVATGGLSAPMNIANVASTAVNSAKPQVEKSGSLGGTGGMLGVQTPYLIITWPRQAVPSRQNAFKGYPSNITEVLGNLSGFTVVDSIHLEYIPATGDELDEIYNLLREGVIL